MYYTASDGVRLYFDDHGSGEPVLMIHGAAGSGMSFDSLANELERDFRVVVVDLRGLSRSDRVDGVGSTTWCDDTLGIADFLGLDQFHVLGCSLGARVGGRMARDHRDRVLSLAVDAPLLEVAQGADDSLNRRFEDLDHPAKDDLDKWQRYHGDDWRSAVRFYGRIRNDLELQKHLTIRPWLPELTLPTLITRGDIDDKVHPLAHCIEWHSVHPGSWLWIEAGTGFSLTQRVPGAYASAFRRFVASVRSAHAEA